MARMPTFEEIAADFGRGVRTAEQAIERPFRRAATPMTPARVPATMAPERAATQGDTMSLATLETDLGNRIGAFEAVVRTEFGKLAADLPGITAEAKQLAANPFAQVALKAAEHAASGILPLNAIATVAGHALQELDDLAALYGPPQQAGQPAQPQQAPAQ